MSMRRQMQFESWITEPGFLIGVAPAAYLSPCHQVVAVGEQHTVATQNHQTCDQIATIETYLSVLCCRNFDNTSAVTREDTLSWW